MCCWWYPTEVIDGTVDVCTVIEIIDLFVQLRKHKFMVYYRNRSIKFTIYSENVFFVAIAWYMLTRMSQGRQDFLMIA